MNYSFLEFESKPVDPQGGKAEKEVQEKKVKYDFNFVVMMAIKDLFMLPKTEDYTIRNLIFVIRY